MGLRALHVLGDPERPIVGGDLATARFLLEAGPGPERAQAANILEMALDYLTCGARPASIHAAILAVSVALGGELYAQAPLVAALAVADEVAALGASGLAEAVDVEATLLACVRRAAGRLDP